MSESQKYYGKYKGTVTDNNDDLKRGRVKISCPDALGKQPSGWATPCVPYAGPHVGLFLIPPVGAHVWIEFERGDLDYPIWSGCFWDNDEAPASDPNTKILKTDHGTITIDDSDSNGKITIETRGGMKITLDSTNIEITDGVSGTINLSNGTVTINDPALEVT
jgi:uncharacterized protein involved in type VI secretion and phage assembly